jgi:hypothetical protein
VGGNRIEDKSRAHAMALNPAILPAPVSASPDGGLRAREDRSRPGGH